MKGSSGGGGAGSTAWRRHSVDTDGRPTKPVLQEQEERETLLLLHPPLRATSFFTARISDLHFSVHGPHHE